jgi:hypothetical protein
MKGILIKSAEIGTCFLDWELVLQQKIYMGFTFDVSVWVHIIHLMT